MSRISIIVPIYNAEKFLNKCIKSVLKQTFKDFELILVNDGSTDKSLEICDRYAKNDKRIKLINKKNEGSVLARKRGIREAKGDYVIFVDADDWISINALEVINEEINRNYADVIVFNYYKVLKKLSFIKRKNRSFYFEKAKSIYEGKEIKEKLVTAYFHGHPFPANIWGKVYKRECLDITEKYVKNIKFLGDDLYVNMEILLNVKKVSLINEALYFYRTGGNTSKYMPYFFNDIIEGYKSQKQVLNEYCFKEEHYGGISIMLINTLKVLIYNLFLDNFSEDEIKIKIKEYLSDYNVIEAINNEKCKKHFNKFNIEYFNSVYYKDVNALYNIGLNMYKNNKIKRLIQGLI